MTNDELRELLRGLGRLGEGQRQLEMGDMLANHTLSSENFAYLSEVTGVTIKTLRERQQVGLNFPPSARKEGIPYGGYVELLKVPDLKVRMTLLNSSKVKDGKSLKAAVRTWRRGHSVTVGGPARNSVYKGGMVVGPISITGTFDPATGKLHLYTEAPEGLDESYSKVRAIDETHAVAVFQVAVSG